MKLSFQIARLQAISKTHFGSKNETEKNKVDRQKAFERRAAAQRDAEDRAAESRRKAVEAKRAASRKEGQRLFKKILGRENREQSKEPVILAFDTPEKKAKKRPRLNTCIVEESPEKSSNADSVAVISTQGRKRMEENKARAKEKRERAKKEEMHVSVAFKLPIFLPTGSRIWWEMQNKLSRTKKRMLDREK